MDKDKLKDQLIRSLSKIYLMDAFSQLTEFLQGELRLLYFLLVNQDLELSPSILSQKLHISRPRITAALTALRNKGFVTTEVSSQDRRRVYVNLTAKGKSFIDLKKEKIEDNFELFVKGLGEDNALELIRLVNLIVNVMEEQNN